MTPFAFYFLSLIGGQFVDTRVFPVPHITSAGVGSSPFSRAIFYLVRTFDLLGHGSIYWFNFCISTHSFTGRSCVLLQKTSFSFPGGTFLLHFTEYIQARSIWAQCQKRCHVNISP